jgi:hypothetical protein
MAGELTEKIPGVIQQIPDEEPAARVNRLMPDTIPLKGKWKNEFFEAKQQVDLQFTDPIGCSGKSYDETSPLLDYTLKKACGQGGTSSSIFFSSMPPLAKLLCLIPPECTNPLRLRRVHHSSRPQYAHKLALRFSKIRGLREQTAKDIADMTLKGKKKSMEMQTGGSSRSMDCLGGQRCAAQHRSSTPT